MSYQKKQIKIKQKVYRQVLSQTEREDHRPWGWYEVILETEAFKIKRIVVYPGKRLSLQRHRRREEHWYVLEGGAEVTLNDTTSLLHAGESVNIPRNAAHRIKNNGTDNVVFIEIQTGDYFGEDDIERLDDDFGRV